MSAGATLFVVLPLFTTVVIYNMPVHSVLMSVCSCPNYVSSKLQILSTCIVLAIFTAEFDSSVSVSISVLGIPRH